MFDAPAITELDRYRGCLLGGAVGDALGAAVEFDDIARIRARFGPDGILDPAEAYGRVGAITDDTQMTLFTAEGVLQADDRLQRGTGFPPGNLWFAYQRWLRTQGVTDPWHGEQAQLQHGELHRIAELRSRRAPGNTCLAGLRSDLDVGGGPGYPIAANDGKGCGGVMRAAPCGLVNWDEQDVFKLGAASAALTHGHPSGYLAAGALALIIRKLCEDRPLATGVDSAIEVLALQPGSREVRDALRRARTLAMAAHDRVTGVSQLGQGWVAEEALAIAVYCALSHPEDFAAAVRLAANHSGDSDSAAAITGNIMGTLLGVDAIPSGWLAVLELRDTIDRLATALHDRFVLEHEDVDWKLWNYIGDPDYDAPAPPHDAYWVKPGLLLAGPYPGAKYGVEAEAKLIDFLDLGVTCFIDLTEEGEGALEPYAELLRKLAGRRGVDVSHLRMPIRDVDVAPPWRMRAVQDAISHALDAGEVVYVHCWGGVGRTGTVIGCHLVENGNHTGQQALAALMQLRRSTQRAHRTSPETSAQRAMVQAWTVA
ncbi:MAG: ADP-ribosylglycohydrolase family protein [Solirubrobacteraceae bacterium]